MTDEQSAVLTFVHPFDLKESEDNPRTIKPERFEALKYALEADPEMMIPRPVIAMLDHSAIAGNMRLRASKAMIGDDEYPNFNAWVKGHHGIPVYLGDFDEKRRREWMFRDNADYGEYVPDEVAALVAAHRDSDGDLALLGFAQSELDVLLSEGGDSSAGAGAGVGIGDEVPDQWGIVVECSTEEAQVVLLERLTSEGYECRALL